MEYARINKNGQQLWNCPQNMEVEPETIFSRNRHVLNALLIHKSCGGKMTHKNFHKILVRELIIHSQEENVTVTGI